MSVDVSDETVEMKVERLSEEMAAMQERMDAQEAIFKELQTLVARLGEQVTAIQNRSKSSRMRRR